MAVSAAWRRLRAQIAPPLQVVHHPQRQPAIGHLDGTRAARILAWLLDAGATAARAIHRPVPPPLPALLRVHSRDWLESVSDPDVVRRVMGGVEVRDPAAVLDVQRLQCGGTTLAARLALKHGRAVHLGGGFHHAAADRGGGFCLLNDVAIAVRTLRHEGWAGRVLVIDLDLHPGDGTRAIFAADDTVFTWSVHAAAWGEPVPAVAAEDRVLGPGMTDAALLAVLRQDLPRIVGIARPELVFYVAGVDGARGDLVGNGLLTAEGFVARDHVVLDAIRGVPWVWLLAGGYGPDAWRYTGRSLAIAGGAPDRPVPSHLDESLERLRVVARALPPSLLAGDDGELSWSDVFGDLGGQPRRFLDFYTPFGLELALERYGVLPAIRARGYEGLRVTVEADHPTGHLARLLAGDEVLIELIARRTRAFPPWDLLYVEWLLLQDPRRSAGRPLLPGQQHPGLGVLPAVAGMLTMAAERLGLDGVAFRPAWYHLAALARPWATFLDPAVERRFARIRLAVEALPLAEATHRVAQGAVRDADGEALAWQAEPMVAPVSEALRAALERPLDEAAPGG